MDKARLVGCFGTGLSRAGVGVGWGNVPPFDLHNEGMNS